MMAVAFAFLEWLGAAGVMTVIAAHVCERFDLFASMGWGLTDSVGHRVDLAGAVIGLTALPIGYLGHRISRWRRSKARPIYPLDLPDR